MAIEQISGQVVPKAVAQCGQSPERIHFVTHLPGGIVVPHYPQTNSLPTGSRIVMLAPPNLGNEVANAFRDAKVQLMLSSRFRRGRLAYKFGY